MRLESGWRLDGYIWHGPNGEQLRAIAGGTGAEIAVLAIAAVAAAASAYGAYSAAESQQDALKAQAKAQEADADAANAAGIAAANNQRRKDRALMESFAARAAGAGVVAREGSTLLSELDFATQSEMEAQNVQYGYRLEERSKKYSAYLSKREAGKINPAMNAGISLLSSAGSVAGGMSFGGAGTAATQTNGGLAGSAGLTGTSQAAYQAHRMGERSSYA